MHIRNVKILEDGSFEESAHYSQCGSLNMVKMIKAYMDNEFTGYIRPDHGRMIWGEEGKPGYGLYDRALGAMYFRWNYRCIEKRRKTTKMKQVKLPEDFFLGAAASAWQTEGWTGKKENQDSYIDLWIRKIKMFGIMDMVQLLLLIVIIDTKKIFLI